MIRGPLVYLLVSAADCDRRWASRGTAPASHHDRFAIRWVRLGLLVVLLIQSGCGHQVDSKSITPAFPVALTTADMRKIQVQVWPPGRPCEPCDAIVFSHGHSLSNRQYDVLFSAWAQAGYVVLAPLHTDSESHPDRTRFKPDEFLELRLSDFKTVTRAVADRQMLPLAGFDLSNRYLAAGHSFGALVAQVAGGAQVTREARAVELALPVLPVGVIAISPPGPVQGYLSAAGWEQIRVPQLVVTGTQDVVPLFAPTWDAHLASYAAGPRGHNVSLVFLHMDHYFNGAFGRIRPTTSQALSAIEQLNRGILLFASERLANRTVSVELWSQLSNSTVRAAAR